VGCPFVCDEFPVELDVGAPEEDADAPAVPPPVVVVEVWVLLPVGVTACTWS
jgi:hypothetical protein